MYQVTVMKGRKVLKVERFNDEEDAWKFYEDHRDIYACEFKNLKYYKVH